MQGQYLAHSVECDGAELLSPDSYLLFFFFKNSFHKYT